MSLNNSNNTIFFLFENDFTYRDYKRYGIRNYEKKGWIVKILIFEPFLFKEIYRKRNSKQINNNYENILLCETLLDAINKLFTYKPKWTIDEATSISKKNYFKRLILLLFFSLFSNRVVLKLAKLPEPVYRREKFSLNFRKLTLVIIYNLAYLPWYLFKPRKTVISGISDFKKFKNRAILAHSFDYDLYLRNKNKIQSKTFSKFALFLDSDEPFHQDYEIINAQQEVEAESYFREINYMLKEIQNNLNLEILIQLHPRADKKKSAEYYKFQISQEETALQISKADIIIGHCTTAFQLAVLYKKPIILLRTNGWKVNGDLEIFTSAFSKVLKIPVYNEKKIKNLDLIPKINLDLYQIYKDKYIKFPGTENIYSSEIISKNLRKIN